MDEQSVLDRKPDTGSQTDLNSRIEQLLEQLKAERQQRDDKQLESIPDCAEALGVGRSYVYDPLIATGELETVHVGKRHLVIVESRRRYVERLRAKNGGQSA